MLSAVSLPSLRMLSHALFRLRDRLSNIALVIRRLLWRLRDLDEQGEVWSSLRLSGDADMVVTLVPKEQEEGSMCRDREALARRDEREGNEVGGA